MVGMTSGSFIHLCLKCVVNGKNRAGNVLSRALSLLLHILINHRYVSVPCSSHCPLWQAVSWASLLPPLLCRPLFIPLCREMDGIRGGFLHLSAGDQQWGVTEVPSKSGTCHIYLSQQEYKDSGVANFCNLTTSLAIFGIFYKAPAPGGKWFCQNLLFHLKERGVGETPTTNF